MCKDELFHDAMRGLVRGNNRFGIATSPGLLTHFYLTNVITIYVNGVGPGHIHAVNE